MFFVIFVAESAAAAKATAGVPNADAVACAPRRAATMERICRFFGHPQVLDCFVTSSIYY